MPRRDNGNVRAAVPVAESLVNWVLCVRRAVARCQPQFSDSPRERRVALFTADSHVQVKASWAIHPGEDPGVPELVRAHGRVLIEH